MIFIVGITLSMSFLSIFRQDSHRKVIVSATSIQKNVEVHVGDYVIISNEGDIVSPDYSKKNTVYLKGLVNGWGSGSHPSTRLCLEFIADHMHKDMVFIDYGCGSGILSIFAAKHGAKKCYGIEVDENSIETAMENASLNQVDEIVDVIHTARIYIGNDNVPQSDITVANILPGALTRLAGTLWGLTKPGGYLCLSGVRPEQLPAVRRFVHTCEHHRLPKQS